MRVLRLPAEPTFFDAERDGSGTWHVGAECLSERDFVRRFLPLGLWTPLIPGPPERVRVRARELRPIEAEATRGANGTWCVGKEIYPEAEFLTLWEPTEPFDPYVADVTAVGRAVRPRLERFLTWVIERSVALRSRVALPIPASVPVREEIVHDLSHSAPAPVAGEVIV